MIKRDILSISLKILGVFSIIYVVRQIPIIASWVSQASLGYLFGTIASIILALVVAYILLRWGDSISKRLMREDGEIPALGEMKWEKAVFKLSLRIVGVVYLISGAKRFVKLVLREANKA